MSILDAQNADPLKQAFEGKKLTEVVKETFKPSMKTLGQATAKSTDDTFSLVDAIDRFSPIGAIRGGIMDLIADTAGIDRSLMSKPFQILSA